jgi:hypothetical protein
MPAPSQFALLLDRFIEIYRHAPDTLEALLRHGEFCDEALEARKLGSTRTVEEVGKRALLEDRLEARAMLQRTLADFPPIEKDEQSFASWEHAFRDSNRVDLDSLASSFGMTPEEFIRSVMKSSADAAAQDALRLDFHAYFAWDFAAKVDEMVARLQGLEELEYSEILSETARRLMQQAHLCYLQGYDAATAIMCGAVLEQTLKEALHRESGELNDLLRDAEDASLLTPRQWGMGDDVRKLRNNAIHNLPKFLKRPEHERATVLSNTRSVVRALLLKGDDHKES